jgi:tRNA dimethylallyltransferase
MNKVIILLGPTCVGKTGVSLLLAKALETEIISADSMQIYQYMDIGTAKPAPAERALIRHHMIDIAEPGESYSTGKYISAVVPIIEALQKKGKIPVIVGGTGLYIKAMTRGLFSGPSADWTLRENLLSMEKEEAGTLYHQLKELDPEAALKITPNDTRRIVRALEVCLKGNTNISEMQKNLTQPLPYEFIKIGLSRDRKELYRMIEKRVDEMIEAGLLEEVRMLMKRTGRKERQSPGEAEGERLSVAPLPSMQAIGYKEIAMYLRGEISLDEAVRLIKRGTKRYAKRQFTWFKKEEGILWIDISNIHIAAEVFRRVFEIVNKGIEGRVPEPPCNSKDQ